MDNVLVAPKRPVTIHPKSQWLSGEGCGSWFHIEAHGFLFIISRYDPVGKIECKGLFKIVTTKQIELNEDYEFTYLSHCSLVNIIQYGETLRFSLIKKLTS